MSWSDRTISYPNTSGSCAISGDGSVIAYGVTGGPSYVNNGVTILSDVGKVTESSVYIQTATGGFAGYGLSLDFAGTQFVTTTVYGSGNGAGGGGYGYLYTRGPNLYESYGNVVSTGPMVATSFSGDVKSHFVSVTSSQIWSGIQNLPNTRLDIVWSNELGLFVSVGAGGTSFSYSFDGITWTPILSVVAHYFLGVTWSKDLGLFVAVGLGDISAKSSDGITWTSSSIGGGPSWQGVTWARELGLFLAVGYYVKSAYSTDGTSWTVAGNLDAINWLSVAWSPKLLLFVAVGENKFSTSPDGTIWTPNAFGGGYVWYKIIWSPERELFVAVGGGDSFAYSSDGLSWTRGSFGVAFSTWNAITWAREVNTFVAFSGDGYYASYSADGINWTTPLLVNPAFSATGIAWSPQNGRFVSTGYENFIYLNVGTVKTPALLANYVSANYLLGDGSSISNIQASSIVQPFANLVVSNSVTTTNIFANTLTVGNVVVATQTGDLAPAASGKINGVNITALNRRVRASNAAVQKAVSSWTEHATPNNYNWISVCWSPELGLFCAVNFGNSNVVMTSSDGVNWTEHEIPNAYYWISMCWSPELGLFCAVNYGSSAVVMTSSDGVNWTEHDTNPPHIYNWSSVCWSPELGLFCAVNYNAAVVMTSSDGVNWTENDIPNAYYWVSVCWSPELGLFCAVNYGNSAVVMTSSNGVNWTENEILSSYNWSSVCWSPELGLFCAVNFGDSNVVMTSSDGVNWTEHTIPNNYAWNSVCWSPELSVFCAVNYGNFAVVMTSSDGVNWTEHGIPNIEGWNSICWSPELSVFCAVNYSYYGANKVMTSAIALPAPSSTLLTPPGVISSVDGKIGIGTDNPGSTLEVAGNVYASNAVTTTNVFATTYYGDGGLLSNINSGFVQPLANLVVSNTVTTSNLSVSGNIIPVTQGNTYIQGNVVVSGNVYSSLGQLGVGGSLLFSLGTPDTPAFFTGSIPGGGAQTNKIRMDAFTQQGASTYISTSANGCFQFTQSGVYTICSNFLTNFNNILGIGIGSNVIDYGTRTDQTYLYSIIPFISQNPTAVLEAQIYVSDLTKYYYIDAFSVDGVTLQPTSSVNGGTWISIAPLGGVAQSVTLGTLGNTVTGRATNYDAQLTDYYIGCTAGITVTLPLGATLTAGKQYVIKDEAGTATTSRITVAATSPNLIDGSSTAILSINYIALTVYWTGAKWSIV